MMNRCVKEHVEHHQTVCSEPDGRVIAFICSYCGWLLQKFNDDWHVQQRVV